MLFQNVFSLGSLLSALVVMTTRTRILVAAAAPIGEQWGFPHNIEASFVSAIALDDQNDKLYLVGTQENAGCWWAQVELSSSATTTTTTTNWPMALFVNFDTDIIVPEEICHNVAVDNDKDGALWIAAQTTTPGGLLADLQQQKSAKDENNSPDALYGMLLDVTFDKVELQENVFDGDHDETKNSTSSRRLLRGLADENSTVIIKDGGFLTGPGSDISTTDHVATNSTHQGGEWDTTWKSTLHGGRLLLDDETAWRTSPVAVASDLQHVYTVSLVIQNKSISSSDNMSSHHKNGFHSLGNPTTTFEKGVYSLSMAAFTKSDKINVTANDSDQNRLVETLSHRKWETMVVPDDNVSIANVAGILLMGDVILVAGSTIGQGRGLGSSLNGNNSKTDSDDVNNDMDGFVTKLVRNTGDLYNERTNHTTDAVTTHRLQTQPGKKEFLHGICAANNDIVYLTGSTEGIFDDSRNKTAENTHSTAFLIKMQVSTLEVLETITIPAEGADSIGISCALTQDGTYVYVGGNVESGGRVSGAEEDEVGGGRDIFVAKVQTLDLSVEWARQLGGAGDDVMAPRGGLVVTKNGDVVVAGNTAGSLYRSESSGLEVFVAVMTANGELPAVVPPEVNTTTAPFEAFPTASPTTSPTATPTSPPTITSEEFNFAGILSMHLHGAPKMTAESRKVFAFKTADFYRKFYGTTKSGRRLQEEVDVTRFDTRVLVTGEDPSQEGNIISYDQTMWFVPDAGDVVESQVRGMILAPFYHEGHMAEYLKMLAEGHSDFENVTKAETPQFNDINTPKQSQEEDDSNGLNIVIIVLIAAGVLLCCICVGFVFVRRKGAVDKDYDWENDMDADHDQHHHLPEQPQESKYFDGNIDRSRDFAVQPEFFEDEMGHAGPTRGFGKDFDHPEKRSFSSRRDDDDAEEFGLGMANDGTDEGRLKRHDSFESGYSDESSHSGDGSSQEDDDDESSGSEYRSDSDEEDGSFGGGEYSSDDDIGRFA